MNRYSPLKLFLRWLAERARLLAVFVLSWLLLLVVTLLYHYPTEALTYGLFLCAFIGLIIGIWDFAAFVKRYRMLYEAFINTANPMNSLPETHKLSEKQYEEIIAQLCAERAMLVSEARAAKDEMTDYYTLWAHQIKTPIAAMHLLLDSGDLNESRPEIYNELMRIEQYTEMALHYLRLESISSDMLLAEYELCGIVKQALKKYAGTFCLKQLTLDFWEFEMTVITDRKWLLFVVEQLLSNAVKYTKKGGISIYADGCTLVIADSGIGIAAEDLPRIFERGFTGYNGRMDRKSTGIGLYLCRQVTRQLGHTLTAASRIGVGTEIRISFEESGKLTKMKD